MKRALLFIILSLFLLTNCYSINKQDSIYYDLYTYLVSVGDMPQRMLSVLNSKNYNQYLLIFDIVSEKDSPDFLDTPFGIYKFQYIGLMDGGYNVLIKHNESYKVYSQTSVTLIIEELIKVRKENPELIDNDLFEAYIEAIIDDELGIFGGHLVIIRTIGHIEYYH
jgi:hypothetical protein